MASYIEYEDYYLQNLMNLKELYESEGGLLEDYQPIDAEIIDYGVCEEDYERKSPILNVPPRLPTQPSVTASNQSIKKKMKYVSVKLVDCNKYPWYYTKYNVQNLARKDINTEKPLKNNCEDNNIHDSSNRIGLNKISEVSVTFVDKVNEESTVKQDARKIASNRVKLSSVEKKSKTPKNKTENGDFRSKDNMEVQMVISQRKTTEIDFKKNKGLVGIKIQTIKVDDKTKEKSDKKDKKLKNKSKKAAEQLNKIYLKAVDKTLGQVNTTQSFDATQTQNETKITKIDQKKQNNKFAQFSKHKFPEKYVSLKCRLKIPSPKLLERIQKRKPIKKDVGVKGRCKKEICNIVQDTDNLKSKETILNPKETKDLPRPKETVEYPIPIFSDYNDSEKISKYENKILNDVVDKQVTRYKIMPKSKRIEEKKNISVDHMKDISVIIQPQNNIEKNKITSIDLTDPTCKICKNTVLKVKSAVKKNIEPCASNSIPVIYKFTQKGLNTIENNLHTASKISSEEKSKKIYMISNESPMSVSIKEKSSLQESSKRKQSVKILSVSSVENIKNTDCRKSETWKPQKHNNKDIIKINRETEPSMILKLSQQPPKHKQYQFPTIVTSRDQLSSNSSGKEQTPNILRNNNHTLKNAQVPGLMVRPPQTSNTFMSNFPNKDGSVQHIFKKNTDFRPSAPRHPMAQPPFPNTSQTIRHQFPLRHISPMSKNVYEQPNYFYPIHGIPQRMPMHDRNIQQFGNNNFQNNVMQQPVYTGQDYLQMGNANMPPGNYDVHSDNVYWPYNYIFQPPPPVLPPPPPVLPPPPPPVPPPPPPPPPPLPRHQDTSNPATSISVIGINNNEFVKNINISAPATNITETETDWRDQIVKIEKIDDETMAPLIYEIPNPDCTIPVSSKTEMMAELEKAEVIENPMKTDFKKPSPLDKRVDRKTHVNEYRSESVSSKSTMMVELEKAVVIESPVKTDLKMLPSSKRSVDQTTLLNKYIPGPLSKKLRFNDNVSSPPQNRDQSLRSTGYSPPILPIPTFQNVLFEVQPPMFEKPSFSTGSINRKCANNIFQTEARNKSKHQPVLANEDSSKKISFQEYYKIKQTYKEKAKDGPKDKLGPKSKQLTVPKVDCTVKSVKSQYGPWL